MMKYGKVGQFKDGMIDGSYDRLQSGNPDKMLREESMQFLYDLIDGKCGRSIHIWNKENAVSVSKVSTTKDSNGRQGKVNHTVILKIVNPVKWILDNTTVEDELTSLTTEKKWNCKEI